jgi:transposase
MLKTNISMIRTLMQALKDALDAIYKLLDQDLKKDMPTLALTIDILCSIPGIGLLTAATIVAEIGDFSAFSKPDRLLETFRKDCPVQRQRVTANSGCCAACCSY